MAESHSTDGRSGDDTEDRRRSRSAELLSKSDLFLLLSIVLIPVAPVFGVHPWVVVITLLATFTLWLLPTQTLSYMVAYEASEGRLFTQAQARIACVGFVAVTLAGLLLVFPYWRWLNLVKVMP